MKRVLTAAVLIPLVLLAIFKAPAILLAVLVGAVAILTLHEFLTIAQAYGIRALRQPTYVLTGLLFLYVGLVHSKPVTEIGGFGIAMAAVLALAPFVFLAITMGREQLASAYPAAAASTFALAYIGLPLLLLVQLRQQWAGAFLLVYLLIVVWAGDTFAYYVGKNFGRHRMAPRVSPKKSWEGAAASFFGSVAVGTLLFWYAYDISFWLWRNGLIEREQGYLALDRPPLLLVILLSAAINIAAQLGDLVESAIKRGAGVKDSGAILPGHGGMLDRIDALLFAAPVLWFYAAWRVMS